RALAVGFAFAVPHRDGGGVGVGIDVKTIVARFQDGERLVGRVDFVGLAAEQVTDVQVQRALIELDLNHVIANVGQSQAGFGVHAKGGAAQVQFGPRLFVSPHAVSRGQGAVHDGFDPVVNATRLNGHSPGNVLQANRAARGIGESGKCDRRHKYRQHQIHKGKTMENLHGCGPPAGSVDLKSDKVRALDVLARAPAAQIV